jgi:hypothetical protein
MQLRSHFARGTVRKSQKDHIVIGKYLSGCFRHQPSCQWGQLWVVLTEERSRTGASRYGPDLHLGMGKQQPEELSACITSAACHRSP